MNGNRSKIMIGVGLALMGFVPVIYLLIFHDEITRALNMNQAFRMFGAGGMDVILVMRGIQLAHAAVFVIGSALAFFGWRKLNAVE